MALRVMLVEGPSVMGMLKSRMINLYSGRLDSMRVFTFSMACLPSVHKSLLYPNC